MEFATLLYGQLIVCPGQTYNPNGNNPHKMNLTKIRYHDKYQKTYSKILAELTTQYTGDKESKLTSLKATLGRNYNLFTESQQ